MNVNRNVFLDRPLFEQIAVVGHVLSLMATFAFATATVIKLAETGGLGDEAANRYRVWNADIDSSGDCFR